jgi:PhoPQ-activated pathogenicity-related protein
MNRSEKMSSKSAAILGLSIAGLMFLGGCAAGAAQPSETAAQRCFEKGGNRFGEALTCYRTAQAAQPLSYAAKGITPLPGVQKRRFELTSQNWSPNGTVQPAAWKHDVELYIPTDALPGRAVLAVSNGVNLASGDSNGGIGDIKPASDFTEEMAAAIARQTRTIVVTVSNVPNQYLTYADDGVARREDGSVAHSWKLFMQAPETHAFMSLHVPMMEAVVKTMDLAEKELRPWKIRTFVATGASKRARAAWLAAIADTRIEAIAPFALDVLNTGKVVDHTYQAYGGNWPLAFGDYRREGMTAQRKTESFDKLLQIEDPLRYLDGPYAQRLAIPKYIVNASGDDFFVPDNTRFYFNRLPGVKTLRVAPNSSHSGIADFIQSSLVAMINRMQRSAAWPTMRVMWTRTPEDNAGDRLKIVFSETPVKVVQWAADNSAARDFRHACGIRYKATPLAPAASVSAPLATPQQGWRASFVEAQFADGFVITTPVWITPDTYPTAPPPEPGPACKTMPES